MVDEREMDVTAKAGTAYVMSFNEAAGGGYRWSAQDVDKGMDVQEISDDPSAREIEDIESVGGNIRRQFRLVAEEAGDYTLTFVHQRPWDKEPAEKVTVNIHVAP